MLQLVLLCGSFFLALYLHLIPLLQSFVSFKPQWFILTFIYWNLSIPHRIGVLTTVGLGLLLDVVEGSTFGRHAIALLFVHFICAAGYQRFRVFTIFQQCILIFGITGIYLITYFWLGTLLNSMKQDITFLSGALSSAIVWPVVLLFLRSIRRRYNIK